LLTDRAIKSNANLTTKTIYNLAIFAPSVNKICIKLSQRIYSKKDI